jgi:hypothetical protein
MCIYNRYKCNAAKLMPQQHNAQKLSSMYFDRYPQFKGGGGDDDNDDLNELCYLN